MGNLCNKVLQREIYGISSLSLEMSKNDDKDIIIPLYTSDCDEDIEKIEFEYNYLKEINFYDYINSLKSFNNDKKNKDNIFIKDDYFKKNFPLEEFQLFIENNILKDKSIDLKLGTKEIEKNIFKDTLINIYKGVSKLLYEHKIKYNKEIEQKNVYSKGDAITLGLLYCKGNNIDKIKFLFYLFSNCGNLKKSYDFDEFLLSLFLTGTYGILLSRIKVGPKYDELGELNFVLSQKYLDSFQLKNSENLVKVTNDLIFGKKGNLNYNFSDFQNKFSDDKNNSFGFLISSKGIRYMHNKNI